jgi:sec-independent protein translocase protein TatC
MANEPGGATPPESRPERSADQTRNPLDPVSTGPSASSDGQPDTSKSSPSETPKVTEETKTAGIQIQPAAHTVSRSDTPAALPTDASKPCPTDSEGRLIEDHTSPVTTTEGTDAKLADSSSHSSTTSSDEHPKEDDNPYHQEPTDYHHHDDYHHDDPYHDQQGEHYQDDPYHQEAAEPEKKASSGGGSWVPPWADKEEGSSDDPEEGGGPVKGFLDHLEDLRWVLIKCTVAVLTSMVICLIAGDKIVALLKYPLEKANGLSIDDQPSRLHVRLGTNEWFLPWGTNDHFGPMFIGPSTNIVKGVVLQPVQIGTNYVLALTIDTNTPQAETKHVDLTVLSPMESFSLVLDIALYGGLGLASPFVFYFLGQFIFPALRKRERKWLLQAVGIGTGLFIAGVLFCYFLVMGVTLFASAAFAEWMGFTVNQWRASEYISFMLKFLVGMGLSFELPVVLLTLVKVRILNYERLAGMRTYMIVILLVISGFITPSGDPLSMFLMALPLYVLYEASIIVAWIWHKRELREEAEAAKAEAAEEKAERDRKS